jgi:hypothetical protein
MAGGPSVAHGITRRFSGLPAIYKHFDQERSYYSRANFKQNRAVALS